MRASVGLVAALVLFGAGCKKAERVQDRGTRKVQPAAGPKSDLPGFDVKIRLSPRAMADLTRRRETIVVDVSFEGGPRPGAPKNLTSDMGEVIGLGEQEVEVAPGATARFSKVQANQEALKWVNGTPNILINVFSGRKSSGDNLLECGIYEGPLSTIADSVLPIDCKLIGE